MEFSEKQRQIITAAEKLFASKGFDGTSVRDIAEEAGVNIAMISYYFGSKEKLMQALFTERTTHTRLKVESLLKDERLSPLDRVNLMADDYIERILQKQHFHKIMMYAQMLEKSSTVTQLMAETKKESMAQISRLIKDGQKQGVFRKDVDIPLLWNVLIGTVTQTLVNKTYYRECHNMTALSDDVFYEKLKKKLSTYIKTIFKALLTYEA